MKSNYLSACLLRVAAIILLGFLIQSGQAAYGESITEAPPADAASSLDKFHDRKSATPEQQTLYDKLNLQMRQVQDMYTLDTVGINDPFLPIKTLLDSLEIRERFPSGIPFIDPQFVFYELVATIVPSDGYGGVALCVDGAGVNYFFRVGDESIRGRERVVEITHDSVIWESIKPFPGQLPGRRFEMQLPSAKSSDASSEPK